VGTYTFNISLNHLLYELVESNLALPSENLLSLGGSTVKEIDLGGTLRREQLAGQSRRKPRKKG